MKRLIPLLVGFFPSICGLIELSVFTDLSDTFTLTLLLGTLLFLPAWWVLGYLCRKLGQGILWPTILANLPMILGLILFCIDSSCTRLPEWLSQFAYANVLPLFSLFFGASFMNSVWLSALVCLIPTVAVFWLGCSKPIGDRNHV